MSLYGPRIRLPKVEIPNPANPSWNLDKEKKILAIGAVIIVIIVLAVLFIPSAIQGISNTNFNIFPEEKGISVTWKDNPLDISKEVKQAEMDILITNRKTETLDAMFNVSTTSQEIIYICPNAIFDANKNMYILQNIAPGDTRKVPCIVRRNPDSAAFSGNYTINITSNLGDIKTVFELISSK